MLFQPAPPSVMSGMHDLDLVVIIICNLFLIHPSLFITFNFSSLHALTLQLSTDIYHPLILPLKLPLALYNLTSLLIQVKFCSKLVESFLYICLQLLCHPTVSLSLPPSLLPTHLKTATLVKSNSPLILLSSPAPVKLNEAGNKHRTADLPHFKYMLTLHKRALNVAGQSYYISSVFHPPAFHPLLK